MTPEENRRRLTIARVNGQFNAPSGITPKAAFKRREKVAASGRRAGYRSHRTKGPIES